MANAIYIAFADQPIRKWKAACWSSTLADFFIFVSITDLNWEVTIDFQMHWQKVKVQVL